MIKSRDEQDLLYKNIVSQLSKYEDNNLEYYTDSDLTKRVLTHPQIGDLKEKMDATIAKSNLLFLKNNIQKSLHKVWNL